MTNVPHHLDGIDPQQSLLQSCCYEPRHLHGIEAFWGCLQKWIYEPRHLHGIEDKPTASKLRWQASTQHLPKINASNNKALTQNATRQNDL